MVLSPKYRYVSLDFETTGLNIQKDDIIQIWLIVFDCYGHTIDQFSSYIRPKSDKQVTTMVNYVTWLDQKQIDNAPDIQDVREKFLSFFDDNTIIIWHNVAFDIAFLERYFPDVTYKASIDTYTLAQNYIHFVPSFALEVLYQYLYENIALFSTIVANINTDTSDTSFHDALYDAKAAASLFIYIAQHTYKLFQTYPQMQYIWSKTDSDIFHICIQYDKKDTQIVGDMPLLNKSVTTPQMMVKQSETPDLLQHPSGTQLYIGNIDPQELAKIIAQQKNIICVFSHKSKADIIKHHLHDMWVYGIATLYEESYFDIKRFRLFMQKQLFSLEESLFLSKYLSHHIQWVSILDVQQDHEKRIIYFLQEKKPNNKAPIIFATHNAFYHHKGKYPDFYSDYTVCFFDQDRRYISYNDFASHAYDISYFLQIVEKIVYTYDICQQVRPLEYEQKYKQIVDFYAYLQIFVGVLSMETQSLLTQQQTASMQTDPLLYHHGFIRTQELRNRMLDWKTQIQKMFPEDIYQDIADHINKCEHILSSMVTINRRDHALYGTSFIYKETNRYIQRHEFLDYVWDTRILFFSLQQDTARPLLSNKKTQKKSLSRITPTHAIQNMQKILQYSKYTYIISTQKHMSQALFDAFCEQWLHKEISILAENITWWMGKNIFIAQRASQAVMIGWYSFFLQMIAKRLYVDNTLIFFIKWSMESLLLCDIQRYGTKK
jgi:DNA polymerase III epsilon subunit-like protein